MSIIRIANKIINHENIRMLHYGKKDYFNIVCGLNDTSLISNESLSENHISK